jgi:hypothetical protein
MTTEVRARIRDSPAVSHQTVMVMPGLIPPAVQVPLIPAFKG